MSWYGFALLSAVCITVVGLLQKRTLREEHSLEYVTIFSYLRLGIILAIFESAVVWRLTVQQAFFIFGGALIGSLAFLLTIKAVRRFEYSSITPIMAIEPGIVAILGVMVLGETLRGQQYLGIFFLTIGAYLITLFSAPGDWKTAWRGHRRLTGPIIETLQKPGGWYIWVALLSFAVSALFVRRALQVANVSTVLTYDIMVLVVVYTAMMIWQHQPITILRTGRYHLLSAILLIAGVHVANSWFQSKALVLAPVALVVAIKRTSTLLDVGIGGRLFHEHHLGGKMLAAGIMIIGTILIVAT